MSERCLTLKCFVCWLYHCCVHAVLPALPAARVYAMPHAIQSFSFRRGTYPAAVHCLAFTPEGYDPPLLTAASGNGSIHLFRLEQPQRSPAAVAATAVAGLLSAVMSYRAVSDMVGFGHCCCCSRREGRHCSMVDQLAFVEG